MLEEMTDYEFDAIRALSTIEPFGEQREDLRMKHFVMLLLSAILRSDDVDSIYENLNYLPGEPGAEETAVGPSVEATVANVALAFGAI